MGNFNPDERHLSEALAASRKLVQGSVVNIGESLWFADLDRPLSAESQEAADEDPRNPVILVEYEWAMVLTQTCDLYWTNRNKHLVHICPVVLADAKAERPKIMGAQPQFINISWHQEHPPPGKRWVADLRHITTIERSVLVGATEAGAPQDPALQRELARNLGRLLNRSSIPNEVVECLRPLQESIKDNYGKPNEFGEVLARVRQLRLSSDPDYHLPPPFDLTVYFLIDEDLLNPAETTDPNNTTLALPREKSGGVSALREAFRQRDAGGGMTAIPLIDWVGAAEELVGLIKPAGSVGQVRAKVVTALTPSQYEDSDVLDLGYLSDSLGSDDPPS